MAVMVHLHEQISKFAIGYLTLNLILFRDMSSIPLLDWKQRQSCIFHDLAHCFPILFKSLAWLSYVGLFPQICLILWVSRRHINAKWNSSKSNPIGPWLISCHVFTCAIFTNMSMNVRPKDIKWNDSRIYFRWINRGFTEHRSY